MITLICGLPNAGKTTYSKNYTNVIHYDEVPHVTFNEHLENTFQLIQNTSGDICIDGGFISINERKKLLSLTNNHDTKICVWIKTP